MSDSDSTVPAGFRVIDGYPRYAINEHGDILSVCVRGGGWRKNLSWKDAKRMAIITDSYGYHRVSLIHNAKAKLVQIHVLVLTAFVSPRPNGMQCRHLDGCKSNNHVSNLAWGTPLENSADKILHGASNRGEKCYKAKLKAADVLEIRARAANGEKLAEIAKDFPVVPTGIFKIVRRETWKHV